MTMIAFPPALGSRNLKLVEDSHFDTIGFARSTGEHIRTALLHDDHELRLKAEAFRRERELQRVLRITDPILADEHADILDLWARVHEVDTRQRVSTIDAAKDCGCAVTHGRLANGFFQIVREWCESLRQPKKGRAVACGRVVQMTLPDEGPGGTAA